MLSGGKGGSWLDIQNLWELYTLLFAIIVTGVVSAFLLTALISALAMIIANLGTIMIAVGVYWELVVAPTIIGLMIASSIICMNTSPPTPPSQSLLFCATIVAVISMLMGFK